MKKEYNLYINENMQDKFDNLIEDIGKTVIDCGDLGGWYTNDEIKITLSVEYIPENK